MNRIYATLAISAVAAALYYAGSLNFSSALPPDKDKVINFSNDDTTMNQAIAQAQRSLPLFWEAFADPKPGDDGFSIKVQISENGYGEHFWTRDVEKTDAAIHARIANDPNTVTTVKLDQRIQVDPKQITDWMYWRGGRMNGAYTLRVMLPRMSKDQAAQFRERLAPLPQ